MSSSTCSTLQYRLLFYGCFKEQVKTYSETQELGGSEDAVSLDLEELSEHHGWRAQLQAIHFSLAALRTTVDILHIHVSPLKLYNKGWNNSQEQ